MPELPEVETVCQGLIPHLCNQTIEAVTVKQIRLRLPVQENLADLLVGKKICSLNRRAKYLIFTLNQGCIISHLGMTGSFYVCAKGSHCTERKHDHIIIKLKNGTKIYYNDARRFGLFIYHDNPNLLPSFLQNLGKEPLSKDFNARYLKEKIASRKAPIKTLLMENKIVVGVGNIYAQESLFLSKISPLREGLSLKNKEIETLVKTIKKILQLAIAKGGTTIKDFSNSDGKPGYFAQTLHVYGRNKQNCNHCNFPLKTITQAGRTTNYCPFCQI